MQWITCTGGQIFTGIIGGSFDSPGGKKYIWDYANFVAESRRFCLGTQNISVSLGTLFNSTGTGARDIWASSVILHIFVSSGEYHYVNMVLNVHKNRTAY